MMDYKAIWDELDEIQQYILREAATIADRVTPGDDSLSETAISGLYLIDLLAMVSGAEYCITPKGRAVYEASAAPPDPTDDMTGDDFEEAMRWSRLLHGNATPADGQYLDRELADLKAQLAAALEREAKLRAALEPFAAVWIARETDDIVSAERAFVALSLPIFKRAADALKSE